MKPQPPEYPRPIPSIDFDELPLLPGTIVYQDKITDTGFDAEAEATERAAKRRRIERAATAYLRGEGLFILSAGLKGPFSDGWKNPWAQGKTKKLHAGLEIPETTGKPVHPRQRIDHRERNHDPFCSSRANNSRSLENATSSSAQRQPGHLRRDSDQKIQAWLRTNDAHPREHAMDPGSSPTPRQRPSKIEINQQLVAKSGSITPTALAVDSRPVAKAVHMQDKPSCKEIMPDSERRLRKENPGAQVENLPDTYMVDEQNHKTMTASSSTPPIPVRSIANNDQEGAVAGHPVVEDSARAEFAIMQVKRRSLQTVPAFANMSPFEYRKVSSENGKLQTSHTPIDPDQSRDKVITSSYEAGPSKDTGMENRAEKLDNVHSGEVELDAVLDVEKDGKKTTKNFMAEVVISPEEDQRQDHITTCSNIPQSTATSDINTIDMLPSAQRHVDISASNVLEERLLDLRAVAAERAGDGDGSSDQNIENETALSDIDTSTRNSLEAALKHSEVRPAGSDVENICSPLQSSPKIIRSTQEILADITPFHFSTVKKSTSKCSLQSTPVTATRPRPHKKSKRASFAPEPGPGRSLNNSIKSALKVGKGMDSLSKVTAPIFEKSDLDMDTSDDDNSAKFLSNGTIPKLSLITQDTPKGILKKHETISATSALSKGTDVQQDGQGLDIVLVEDDNDGFNLEEAIDDLGSFLGTWDVDKEFSGLSTGL